MEQFVTNVPFGTLRANIDKESDIFGFPVWWVFGFFFFWFLLFPASSFILYSLMMKGWELPCIHRKDQDIPNAFFFCITHSICAHVCLPGSSGAFSLVPVLFVRYLLRGVKGYLFFICF